MNEEISKKIAEVDAAIRDSEQKAEYYRGMRDAFEKAIELLNPPVLSGYLKETEDERIRKELKEAFEAYDIESMWNGIPIRSIFAWLENQKEQKPSGTEALKDLPRWKFARQGTKLPGASVIIYNEDPDPRMGTVAVKDCIYIPIADLNRLPLLELKSGANANQDS